MRYRITTVSLIFIFMIIATGFQLSLVSEASPGEIAVFPGAEGFGTNTSAGRGGQLVRVTTLNYDGPGSLKEALRVKGPKVIVFEVAGTIWSGPGIYDWWNITEPFVTIAGQTAPSPGITLAGSGIRIMTHDVLIQHLRVRSGDREEGPLAGNRGAIKILGPPDGPPEGTYNVVVDHCSFSWGTDQTAGTWYPDTHDITLRHCIISEDLHCPAVAPDIMSMGLLVGDHTRRLSLIGNLFAHNYERNPHLKSNTSTVIVNNVIYNPGRRGIHFGYGDAGPTLGSVVGNVFLPGPDTYYGSPLSRAAEVYIFNNVLPGTGVYLEDNESPYRIEGDEWSVANIQAGLGFDPRAWEPPLWLEPLTVRPSNEVLDWVLPNAGARPWDRDAVDERIISDVLNGTGNIIGSQDDVGGWPELGETHDVLDPPDDPSGDDDGDGYTNLEEWLFGFEPTNTPNPTATSTPQPTGTPTPTSTSTPTATATNTPTFTPTNTPTPTCTPTPTSTSTPYPTNTPTLLSTSTPTPTATNTPTLTPTNTPTPTSPTATPTASSTLSPMDTPVPMPDATATATFLELSIDEPLLAGATVVRGNGIPGALSVVRDLDDLRIAASGSVNSEGRYEIDLALVLATSQFGGLETGHRIQAESEGQIYQTVVQPRIIAQDEVFLPIVSKGMFSNPDDGDHPPAPPRRP